MKQHLLLALAASVTAHATSVSWNYDNNSTVGGNGAGSLPPLAAQAGASGALAGGWHNSWPSNPLTNLRDDSGGATTLDISYTSTNGSWSMGAHPGQDGDGSWNKELINGYLNAGGAGNSSSVTLSEIPYSSYDVYVYFSADVADREGSVTNGSTTYYFRTIGAASKAGTNATLTQATDTTDDAQDPLANYAVFQGLSGASQTVTVTIPNFGGIAGIQVVAAAGSNLEFVSQPQPFPGNVGGTVTLTANATSPNPITYQWQYSPDGGAYSDLADGGSISGATTNTLTIDPAEYFAHQGFYQLIANDGNVVISDPAQVTLSYPAPAVTAQPQGGAVQVGSDASLTVAATGLGTLSYQWYKDNAPLADGGAIFGSSTATLGFVFLQAGEAGTYHCVVTDHAATEQGSGEANTTVQTSNAVLEVFDVPASTLLSFEPFSAYPEGVILTDQTPAIDGYSGAWLDEAYGNVPPTTSAGSLAYGGAGYVAGIGGKVGTVVDTAAIGAGNSGRAARMLAANLKGTILSSQTRYLSWLFKTGNEGTAPSDANNYQVLGLWNGASGNDSLRVFEAGIALNDFGTANYGFRVNNTTAVDLGVAADTGVHLFVAKIELNPADNSDSVTVWIDPTLGAGEPAGGVSVTGVNLNWDRLTLSDYAGDSSNWDEIRWGTTFDSVTTEAPLVPLVPEITLQPINENELVGGAVTLEVVADGDPAPTYQWEISPNGTDSWVPVSGGDSATLVIDPAAYSDSGFYRAVASNINGIAISDTAQVTISYPSPEISQQPTSSVFVTVGSNPSFSVTATYLGPVAYEWYKVDGGGDILLTNGGNISGADTATLQFTGVTAGDDGNYYVKVIDNAGLSDTGSGTSVISTTANLTTYTPVELVNVVSWNFNVNGDSPNGASTTAGVADVPFWNDTSLDALTNPANNLKDSTGAATSVDISWSSYNTWSIIGSHPGADTDGTLNREMLNGYLNAGPAPWNPPTTESSVTLSQIPYTSYDIIVYFGSDVAGREANVTDGATTYSFNTLGPASINDASGNAVFVKTTDTGGTYATAANYAVFSGLSGTTQTISVQFRDADEWGGIAGIQIVPATEATNDFTAWIGNYPGVGGLTGFNDDADGDGIANGLENLFGTDPSVSSAGITQVAKSGSTVTFQHPQNASAASDVSAAYEWSTDIATFHADGASDGGTTVSFSASPDTPVAGTTTVTATITGTVPAKLFARLKAIQTP